MSNNDATSAHALRALEKENMNRFVMWQGTKAAIVGGIGSIGASLAAQKFSNLYRHISLPFKVFIVLSVTTGSFFTVAGIF